MTQVAFVAAGSAVTTTNGTLSSIPFPTGVAVGDLCIIIGAIAAPARTYAAPTGWSTTIYAANSTATNGPTTFISTKVYTSGDTAPTFTVGGTSLAGAGAAGRMFAYRNAASSISTGTVYTSGATAGTTVGPVTGVTVTGLGLVLVVGAWSAAWSSAPSAASGWTLDANTETTAATVNISYTVQEKAYASATSASVSPVGPSATRAGIQIAINEGVTALNKVKVGATQVTGIQVGTVAASKVYVGTTQVWP